MALPGKDISCASCDYVSLLHWPIRSCSLYHAQEHILLEHQACICTCSCHCICSLVKQKRPSDQVTYCALSQSEASQFIVIHFYIMVAWWWYPLPYYIKSFIVSCVFMQIHLILVHITCYECLTSCIHYNNR